MGGAGFSQEKYNARETALSSDLGRGERLMSRELQNVLGFGSADGSGAPFSSLLRPLSLTAATGFTMQLADGDALFYFPTDPTLTADDSPMEVVRWRSVAPLAFATPDATNPRIDLVVAQPGMVDTDLVSRNILVDPVARTIAAQSVNKTSNPAAVITVITGTPAGSPLPPSVPAGKVALLEVWIPAGAANSAAFPVAAPRLFRRAPFPWSIMSGIILGCRLRWDLTADPSTTSSSISFVGTTSVAVIDGEVIDCSTVSGLGVSQDAANNPFGVAAGASDKPYYIYAVGGKNAPQATLDSFGALAPIAVVESLTPPNPDTGQPTAPITTPRGTTTIAGAVYIGLGFVVAGTTRRRPCIMDGDWTTIVGSDIGGLLGLAKTGAGVEALGTPASKPSISRRMLARLGLGAASATAEVHLHPDQGDGAAAAPSSIGVGSLQVTPMVKTQVAGNVAQANVEFHFNPLNARIWIGGAGLATGDVIQVTPMGYDHRVQRIAAG